MSSVTKECFVDDCDVEKFEYSATDPYVYVCLLKEQCGLCFGSEEAPLFNSINDGKTKIRITL